MHVPKKYYHCNNNKNNMMYSNNDIIGKTCQLSLSSVGVFYYYIIIVIYEYNITYNRMYITRTGYIIII